MVAVWMSFIFLLFGETAADIHDSPAQTAMQSVPFTTEEGGFFEMTTSLDDKVYTVNIPSIRTATNDTVAVMTVYNSPGNISAISPIMHYDRPIRFGSHVIGLDIITKTGKKVLDFIKREPILVTFPVSEIREGEQPVCLSHASRDDPYWYTNGCYVISAYGDKVTCTCDHSAHFVILLQLQKVELEPDFLTIMGISLSLFTLGLTGVAGMFYRLTSNRVATHANLALSLLALNLTNLFIDTEDQFACISAAILYHFFLQASFTWISLEGLFMFTKSRDLSGIGGSVCLLVGWGCPTVLVSISVVAGFVGFANMKSCFNDDFAWLYLSPVVYIIIMKTMIVFHFISEFFTGFNNKGKAKIFKINPTFRMLMLMELPLGVCWILSLMYVRHETILFAYAYAALDTLQVLLVFLPTSLNTKEEWEKFEPEEIQVVAS